MAKQKDAVSKGSISRKRRNSLERRCLPKDIKRQFMGSDRTMFKLVLAAWKDSRKKANSSVLA